MTVLSSEMTIFSSLAGCETPTVDPFEELNRAVSGMALQVANTGQLISLLGRECPASQVIREFVHNGIHAICKVGPQFVGDLYIEPVLVDGVMKLAITENGEGMSAAGLHARLLTLQNSGGGIAGSRYGVGARVAGVEWSPAGVEYITWNGEPDSAVRGKMFLDVDGEVRWFEETPGQPFTRVAFEDLPEVIRRSGHGTQVILHGRHAQHDTFQELDVDSPMSGNKAYIRSMNSRYVTLPERVRFHVAGFRNKNSDDPTMERRHSDVVGLKAVVTDPALARYHAAVSLSDSVVHVYVLNPPADVKTKWRSGDNAVTGKFVAAVVRDGEVPEVTETYDRFEAHGAYRRLQGFGLGPISTHTVLLVYPKGATPNAQRTRLTLNNGDLPWERWEKEFRAAMPNDLAEIVDEALSSSSGALKAVDHVRSFLSSFASLLSPAAFGRSKKMASVRTAGGSGAQCPGAGSHGGSPSGVSRGPSQGGGAGSSPGGVNGSSLSQGRVAAEVETPSVNLVDAEAMRERGKPGLAGFFEPNTGRHGALYVNTDFSGLKLAVDAHLAGHGAVSGVQLASVKHLMVDRVASRMVLAVSLAKAHRDAEGLSVDDFEALVSPEALTGAAFASVDGTAEIKRAVTAIMSTSKA